MKYIFLCLFSSSPLLFVAQHDSLPANTNAQIVDMNGKVEEVLIELNSVDVEALSPGKYIFRLENQGRIEQVSFIKL